MNYERELLYNQAKLPDHPVASLRFENQSGLTLERGPVTLVEDGDYKGEAIIPFTKDQNAVYVPYAVELGVTVKEEFQRNTKLRGLSIEEQFLKHQLYVVHQTTYTIENATHTDKIVTIEAPKQDNFDLFDTPAPDAETLNEQRWKISVPADETAVFVRQERQMRWHREDIRHMKYHELGRYLKNRYIDNALVDDLHDVLDTVQSINDMRTQIQTLNQERQALYEKQEQLRKNMGSLGSSGKEGTLRQRVVDQLEASQDRLEAIDAEVDNLKSAIIETEQIVVDLIGALGEKYPSA